MNNSLEKYYRKHIKTFYGPEFNQLTKTQVHFLKISFGFTWWRLSNALTFKRRIDKKVRMQEYKSNHASVY